MSLFRIVWALSRPARLPTVWSNCLAGWWLGAGGNSKALPVLLGAATCLSLGGTYLNDALDATYDRQHRRSRSIAPGQVTPTALWRCAVAFLAAGVVLGFCGGKVTGGLGLGLAICLVLYNAIHRLLTFSPVLEGLSRFFLYLLGASAAEGGVTGWAIWCGLALAAYVAGSGFFTQWEKRPEQTPYWPAALLLVPIFFALIMNVDRYRAPALLLSAVLLLWLALSVRPVFWGPERRLDQTLPKLRAGIVLVDWLAIAPVAAAGSPANTAPRALSFAFIGLLAATLLLQRLQPER